MNSVLLYTKCLLFRNFIFFFSSSMFFVNHAYHKYQPDCLKVGCHLISPNSCTHKLCTLLLRSSLTKQKPMARIIDSSWMQ